MVDTMQERGPTACGDKDCDPDLMTKLGATFQKL